MTTSIPFTISPGDSAAPAVDWLNTNLHPLFAGISVVADAILDAVLAVLTALPPLWMIAAVALLAWLIANWRVGLLAVGSLGFCWAMGLWTAAMQTVDLVLVAVLMAVAIAFPLGIWASRDKRAAPSSTSCRRCPLGSTSFPPSSSSASAGYRR